MAKRRTKGFLDDLPLGEEENEGENAEVLTDAELEAEILAEEAAAKAKQAENPGPKTFPSSIEPVSTPKHEQKVEKSPPIAEKLVKTPVVEADLPEKREGLVEKLSEPSLAGPPGPIDATNDPKGHVGMVGPDASDGSAAFSSSSDETHSDAPEPSWSDKRLSVSRRRYLRHQESLKNRKLR